MFRIKFYILFLLISFSVKGQDDLPFVVPPDLDSEESTEVIVVVSDTIEKLNYTNTAKKQVITEHKFEKHFQKKYDFDYSRTKPRMSLWNKLKSRFYEFFKSIFPDKSLKGFNNGIEILIRIFYVIIIVVVVYFVVKFAIKKEGRWFLGKKNVSHNPDVNPLEENIHEIDFKTTINTYESEGNYRMAIRYHFLQTLKSLTDSEKIEWKNKKTNIDYLSELKNSTEVREFQGLVYIFDHVWYGEFDVDANKYKDLVVKFNSFKI